MRPKATDFRFSLRPRGIVRTWVCLLLGLLLWGGKLLALSEEPELIRRQDEEEAQRKVLRASDTLDQIEGTVEGHTRELQRLQQELSQVKEELRHLHERLAQASASAPEPGKTKAEGNPARAHASPPEPGSAGGGDPHAKVVTGYYYKTQAGDTLSAIAEAYRQSGVSVTAEQIRAANGLSRRETLRPGQKLFIPKGAVKKKRRAGTAPNSPPAP
ncbi:LysM peptidoglycan-binding domain-containing protein [Methylacidimicrobium cyclopophantes]|nr:LysM peptidoglycan-binding domain-containing protein [Methylacidimicrobium cyclopophantes]